MYCPNCGQELTGTARFCDRCGSRVGVCEGPGHTGPDEYDMASILVNKKSEGLAILLSFIITGLGQMYVGRIGRGICLLVVQIAISVLVTVVISPLSYSSPGVMLAVVLIMMSAVLILWVFGMYDAYCLAKEYNQNLLRRGGGYY